MKATNAANIDKKERKKERLRILKAVLIKNKLDNV